jgi:hypothetical protein
MSTTPIQRVLDRLADSGLHETGSGWSARCPAHEDRKASLSIAEGDGGRVVVFCHAGCDHKKIVAALGLEEADLFDRDEQQRATTKAGKPKKPSKAYATARAAVAAYQRTLGTPSDGYEYEVAGELVGLVIRWSRPDGTKEIRPVSRHADGWRLEHMPEPRPLYRLSALTAAASDRVYVVEGEKCVEAAGELGLLATTSSAGGNAASKTDWSPLAGRDVVILPDADAAGRKYADEVSSILIRLDPPAVVRIVDLAPDDDDGSDVADLAEPARCLGEPVRDHIKRLADETSPLQPPAATPAATSSPATSSSAPVEAFKAYPVDALPEPLATYVAEAADAIGCDPAYVALPLLTVAGSAIGTTRRLELKAGYNVPAILWSVLVGESGTSKSPALRSVLEHVRSREKKLREEYALDRRDYEDAIEVYERERSAWRASKAAGDPPERPAEPVSRRCLVTDVTVEALAVKLADAGRGLLLARDELAGWLGGLDRYANKSGGGGSDESFYLSAYNGEPHAVDRRTGDRREVYVASAALWVCGSIQPGVLRRALGTAKRESGLLARLLLTAPPARPATWTEKEVSPLTRQWLHDVLDRLYELAPDVDAEGREEPRLVRLEPDAKKAYVAWHDRHGEELAELTGDRAAAWSKLRETAARLALIVHAVRVAAGDAAGEDVDAESMGRALRLVEWHKHEVRRVYSILGQTDEEAAERQSDDRLAAWIERRGGTTTARDLISACRWIATSDEAEAALRRLVAAGRGEWHDRPPSERGGRPTRDFILRRQPAVEAREPLSAKPPSAKPRGEAAKRGFGCADAAAVAQIVAAEPEEAVEI